MINWREKGEIPYVNILIRVHPFDKAHRYKDVEGEEGVHLDIAGKILAGVDGKKDVALDKEAFINLKSTLAYTDLNINYKSTISLESFIFEKPVINFVNPSRPMHNNLYYDKSSYYYPVVEHGAARVTKDEEELKLAINEYLLYPERDNKEPRRQIAKKFFAFFDGQSYKRNVDFLDLIIKRES